MKKAIAVAVGRTEKGPVRSENQDQFFIANLSRSLDHTSSSLPLQQECMLRGDVLGNLFIVADGMGGHRGGRQASEYAIQHFVTSILNSLRWIVKVEQLTGDRFLTDLQSMLTNAHRAIQKQAEEDPSLKGMGTTLTIGYVTWPLMTVIHAGDTRCYVWRNGELKQITRDHTVADQLVRSGQLDAESEQKSPWSNVLVNALGADAHDVVADIYQLDLEMNDRLVFCSDGLNKHVEDASIAKILKSSSNPSQAVDRLIEAAIEDGGSDNVTVVVVEFEPNPHSARMNVQLAEKPSETQIFSSKVSEDDVDTTSTPDLKNSPSTETPTSDFINDTN